MSIAETTTPSADQLVRDGLTASQANLRDAALRLFEQATVVAPRWGVPHFLIGAELAQAGRFDEAEGAYANAVLLAPDLDMARYQLGLLQFTSGRAALALVTFGPLFERPPDYALQRVVRGFAALAQDELAAAVEHFKEGIALNHDNPSLNGDLEMLMRRIAERSGADRKGEAAAGGGRGATPAEPVAGDENQFWLSNYQRQSSLH
jgi:tetratricopeptide (TPR) repeat protein